MRPTKFQIAYRIVRQYYTFIEINFRHRISISVGLIIKDDLTLLFIGRLPIKIYIFILKNTSIIRFSFVLYSACRSAVKINLNNQRKIDSLIMLN